MQSTRNHLVYANREKTRSMLTCQYTLFVNTKDCKLSFSLSEARRNERHKYWHICLQFLWLCFHFWMNVSCVFMLSYRFSFLHVKFKTMNALLSCLKCRLYHVLTLESPCRFNITHCSMVRWEWGLVNSKPVLCYKPHTGIKYVKGFQRWPTILQALLTDNWWGPL